MALCGKVEVAVHRGDGYIFTGVGAWGWRRDFDWEEIDSVYLSRGPRPRLGGIVLAGPERIKFGTFPLSEERRTFMVHVLLTMLCAHDKETIGVDESFAASAQLRGFRTGD
jgi:hypothetical protein